MAVFLNESCVISQILSHIGYDRGMRTVRQNAYKCMETSLSRNLLFQQTVISGSKGEGLSALYESDFDFMYVLPNVVCSEHPVQLYSGEQMNRFVLFKRGFAPGYALLQLINICENLPVTDIIKDCLVELLPEQYYISSDIWKQIFKQSSIESCLQPGNRGLRTTSNETHGPSVVISQFQTDCDRVYTMICYCPTYLYSWVTRKRQYNWPTTAVIEEVSELESHAVPVGNINSPLQFLEWRICYTRGEIKLIHTLPDCLVKVYILMKAIAKVALKPISKDMSSYIIKNIVLWTAELSPFVCFSEGNLVTILQYALKFLKQCLVQNNLPSYMIPERNLFADRVTLQQRSRLCMRIHSLLREGPSVVLRVKKMRDALNMLYRSPEEFRLFSVRRQKVETLMLLFNVYTSENFSGGIRDIETNIRILLTDGVFNKIGQCVCIILGLDGISGDAALRIDPDDVIRTVRGTEEGRLISILRKYVY
ncbi:uncharacterized protein LOC123525570 [Mercenaria mercenaria]|uniref:uncharacterized protein LOC123525570 n=1 Tax=Mercenaria mercenaria TaxID=6596 RepID=UPI00234F3DCE|nr:uncharacterized protein LOC123525570 [Mercenaria mercenaria]